MAEQPITVTVEGIAATLEKLTIAARDLERFKNLYAAGPAEGSSGGFRSTLDFALRQFGSNVEKLQVELRELRNAVQATGEEIIDLDSDYAHLHGDLSSQLSAASASVVPPKNAI